MGGSDSVKVRTIGTLSAALTLILGLAACDRFSPSTDIDPVPPQAVQPSATAAGPEESASLVEPHRYLRLNDLAAAIRNAGHSCEAVRTYNQIEQNDKGSAVYKIDCLEYSYQLTVSNGRSRIERWTANVIRE
jgi:hypothetical protein